MPIFFLLPSALLTATVSPVLELEALRAHLVAILLPSALLTATVSPVLELEALRARLVAILWWMLLPTSSMAHNWRLECCRTGEGMNVVGREGASLWFLAS
jgi:hypothetical protein